MPLKRTAAAPRYKPRENMYFEPGVRGRKTGLTVPDSGIRDEYGIEPMDELFSSPAKLQPISSSTRKSAMKKNANTTLTSEEDMDVGQSTIPEPSAVLTERKRVSMRMPPPRSKSPVKTFLKSPARRHPSLGPVSSPTRGSAVSPSRVRAQPQVARRLDFSTDDLDGNAPQRLPHVLPKRTSQRNLVSSSPAKRPSGVSSATRSLKPAFQSQEESEEVQGSRLFDLSSSRDVEDDYEPIYDDQALGSPEPERAATPPEPTPPPPKKRGRPPKHNKPKPSKNAGVDEDQDERPAKKQRGPTKLATQKAHPKPKPEQATRLQKQPAADSSPAQIQRGPPRPRQNGLFILRRETPELGNFATTRSGRASIKPVAYWKNETIVYGEDDTADTDASFLLPTIKEVIRHDDVEKEKSKRGKKRGPKAHKRAEDEEEDASEPWESEPGRIYGAIRAWNPDDPTGAESADIEDEIAFSNAAIITREISGSTVKFAKILTLPFFGCGMVDLPPGAVKKPKNARKMQMIFFVHKGKVVVTVGDNDPFRIGTGGMWQVPRGNLYSIGNDSDKTARVFFAQGCEVEEVE
ncbi:hypothetical protein GMDG_02887 [Pseudogymnoascus destructans 20631-21]|uniref:CENP-C homolog n=1 Tax=Pseudogymnoascus destructans (strain ATCC MYA-4855 / 20631-21) TaxID=658429 RepID=L8G5E9_PSED2|nr:hypothetical protein GMDG_02887 [Pseudogymnoascus destructans 20631-21]